MGDHRLPERMTSGDLELEKGWMLRRGRRFLDLFKFFF